MLKNKKGMMTMSATFLFIIFIGLVAYVTVSFIKEFTNEKFTGRITRKVAVQPVKRMPPIYYKIYVENKKGDVRVFRTKESIYLSLKVDKNYTIVYENFDIISRYIEEE